MTNKSFTSTEVGTMLESLRSEFHTVSEVIIPMREDIAEIKDRLTAVETRLIRVEDIVRIAVPSHERRITALEVKVGIA